MHKLTTSVLALLLLSGHFIGLGISFLDQNTQIYLVFLILILYFLTPSLPKNKSFLLKILIYFFVFFSIIFLTEKINTTIYAQQKYNSFIFWFCFSTLSSFIFISNKNNFVYFFKTYAYISLLIISLSLIYGNYDPQGRLQLGHEGNPIWLGRAAGFVFIYFTYSFFYKKNLKFILKITGIALSLYILYQTGSRGPIASIALCYLTLRSQNLISTKYNKNKIAIYLIIFYFLIFSAIFILNSPHPFTSRIFSADNSGRTDLFNIALNNIYSNPFGIGIGGFSLLSSLDYPHNLLIEILIEFGLLVFSVVFFFLSYCFYYFRKINKTENQTNKLISIFYFYFFYNSMFSGDITSAKEIYLIIPLLFYKRFFSESNKKIKTQQPLLNNRPIINKS